MKDLFTVKDKIVLVTGGTSGIGEMVARAYVENGANVYVVSRSEEACERVAGELSAHGRCTGLPCDITASGGIAGLVSALSARESRLDILINNAGVSGSAPIDDYGEDLWDSVVDLNLKAVFFMTQKLLPLLGAAARPDSPARVINMASVHGVVPSAFENYAYSASKAGCLMLTRHLAKMLAVRNILVNAIAPGPFESRMTASTLVGHWEKVYESIPLKRIGTPGDIGGTAIFLGSDASAYLTGAIIPCDGGFGSL